MPCTFPEPMKSFESCLLHRVAQAVEAGEVSADLLTELQAEIETARAIPKDVGDAAAIRQVADLAEVPEEEAAKTLAGIETQPSPARELLMHRIAEAWLEGGEGKTNNKWVRKGESVSVFGKPPTEVSEADLQSLVQHEVRERQALDFKRDPYGKNDDGKLEMLKDISAMANAYGGEILLGVDESGEGIASEIVGIPDGEREAQSIVSSCLSTIDERIRGLATHPVPLSNGRHVVIIQIPQSLRAPHMVTYKGRNQFWARHDRQKSPMSTDEIRDACSRVEMLTTKLQEFLQKRLANVDRFAGGKPTLAFSLTPILVQRAILRTGDQKLRRILRDSKLSDGRMPHPCITGLENDKVPGMRLRLDRNGHLDVWEDLSPATGVSEGNPAIRFLNGGSIIFTVFNLCTLGKAVYEHCGVAEVLMAKLDLWNIKGLLLRGPDQVWFTREAHPSPDENLNFELLEVDSLQNPKAAAKTILDRLWEAFGFDQAPSLEEMEI